MSYLSNHEIGSELREKIYLLSSEGLYDEAINLLRRPIPELTERQLRAIKKQQRKRIMRLLRVPRKTE